jgi:hypothetical protein
MEATVYLAWKAVGQQSWVAAVAAAIDGIPTNPQKGGKVEDRNGERLTLISHKD